MYDILHQKGNLPNTAAIACDACAGAGVDASDAGAGAGDADDPKNCIENNMLSIIHGHNHSPIAIQYNNCHSRYRI